LIKAKTLLLNFPRTNGRSLNRDYSIKVVKRAFEALEVLASAERGLGVTEVAQALGVSCNSAFRLLHTLEESGYVRRDPNSKKYFLGLRLFELGNAVFHSRDLRELARPILQQLLNRFQETVNLAVLQDMHVVYIERLESPLSLRTSSTVGSRANAHSTSLGKAMLAFLPQGHVRRLMAETKLEARTAKTITDPQTLERELELTRQRGYAVDDGENLEGVCCVGAPVFDSQGSVVAAISVSAPLQRLNDLAKRKEIGLAVMQSAYDLSLRLGFTGERSVH
jgi:DNA-binding IclR family transcriptional regulator